MSIFGKKLLYDYKHFERKHIQDLMKSILLISTSHGKGCRICTSYKLWAIKALKNKWNRFYVDVETVIERLCEGSWCTTDQISQEPNSLFLFKNSIAT